MVIALPMRASRTGGFPGALTCDFTGVFGTPISGHGSKGACEGIVALGRPARHLRREGLSVAPLLPAGAPRAPEVRARAPYGYARVFGIS